MNTDNPKKIKVRGARVHNLKGRGGSELVSQTKILIRKDLKYEHRQS